MIGYIFYFAGLASLAHGGAGLLGLGGLLLLAYWILFLVGYFSMAASMRRELPSYGLAPEIGGVTLFFFAMFYLQAQLSWVAHWKRTGRTFPRASKGVFWALFCLVPFMIAILAAISIPAYQDYIIRAQVSEGMALGSSAETAVAEYYASHQALPPDNASASLEPVTSLAGKYVSGVEVSDGRITVAFDTLRSNALIRNEVLVLAPFADDSGRLVWRCGAPGTTVPEKYLPIPCRQ